MRDNPKKKRTGWKITALLLILAGVCLMAYPFLREYMQEREKDALLDNWKQELSALDEAAGDVSTEDTSTENSIDQSQLAGELQIASIDLDLPVIIGATPEHLNISCCLMEPATEPGAIGTIAIAGHHSSTYGRHFNRLEEVNYEDKLLFVTADGVYSYEVDQIQVVEPEDVWVLDGDGKNSRLTLITCYYAADGTTKRLVVSGKFTGKVANDAKS